MTPAETGSIDATSTSTATGTTTASTTCGRYRAKAVSSASTPADGDGRHLGALGAVERRGPVAQPPLDEVEPELREHVRRGAPSRDLEPPGVRRARDDDGREQRQRRADLRERGAVERACGDAREEDGLGEDEQRGDDPEHASAARRTRTGRARQIRRGSIARTGASCRSFGATRSTGASPRSSPPSRARKTWYVHAW